MRNKTTPERLKELVSYDPETGSFKWLPRELSSFSCERWGKAWNRRYAGKNAGANGNGYIRVQIDGELYLAHRLAWLYVYGEWPLDGLDHKDGNPSNNAIKNLRECSKAENNRNMRIPVSNTSGYKGVSWNARARKWHSKIKFNGKTVFLGAFDSALDAHIEYRDAAHRLHGAFARIS